MKPSLAIVILLLPCITLAGLYDESSTRKVNLEDIEDEHLQSERRSKATSGGHPSPLPPPLSRQPAKGQPIKSYPPSDTDQPSTTHRYSTRAQQHHVQPLTDQSSAPEADYQQSPAFRHETIVYFPQNGQQQQHHYDVVQPQQQPSASPVFYYSHDVQQKSGHEYQVQFVPIGQHGGPDEQHSEAGPEVTPSSVISYSHEAAAFGDALAPSQQQYVASNEIREPQQVYGLPGNGLFESQKDIEYAKPATAYGPPPRSQQPYSGGQKPVEYSQLTYTSHDDAQPASYFNHEKDIEYAQHGETGNAPKPAITYGPPDTAGHVPQIQYGVPDAPFRRPVYQSNQNAYAPRRPESLARSNEKQHSVNFPYPPSFVSITTKRPYYEKSAPVPEPSYNELPQEWQHVNVMPLQLIPPTHKDQYRSFGHNQVTSPTAAQQIIGFQSAPYIDIFQSRHAKSLIDSYVPSWLVAQMQEEHARQLHQHHQQQQQQQQPTYAIPSPASEAGYNTIAYSTQFENIYGRNLKRSIQTSKGHQKKKVAEAANKA